LNHFGKRFDEWRPTSVGTGTIDISKLFPAQLTAEDITEFRQLMKDFRVAVKAAKVVDKLTGQPDCEDLEKKKLEDKVAELERRLAAIEKINKSAGKSKSLDLPKRKTTTKKTGRK
jgi:chromosome condensin MukBEF MukE localization factor